MLIGGWGKDLENVADAGFGLCKNCNNTALFDLKKTTKKADLFFVPVAKWGAEYFLVCSTCDAGYEISEQQKDQLVNEMIERPDNKKMAEIWNKMDELLVNLMKQEVEIGKWQDVVHEKMSIEYKISDLDYIYRHYLKNLMKEQ